MTTTFNDTYEIKSVIGKGGMSTVYLAEHMRLHTSWAVKEVRKQQGAKFDFLAESNILKRLQHPMLPRIVDIFENEDFIYIVEDFVEGVALDKVLKERERIDEAQAVQWFKDLCEVLRYLHNQKPNPIIYRDLKPSNIMLQPDGTLKLIDFGIAREFKEESQGDTAIGGTRGYAAPEQFGQAQTDARTDIYSLGVTMYHVITGKSPYKPPYNFVPVRELVPTLSHGIEHILSRCIQLEPEDRYRNVNELLDDLKHSYKYDKAYRKYRAKKLIRTGIVAAMFVASLSMMAGGYVLVGEEKENAYYALLQEAGALYLTDFDGAVAALDEARAMFPERADADRQQTYALYLNGRWQECIDFGTATLEKHGTDNQVTLSVASAQYELGNYAQAAVGFAQSSVLTSDNLRDYAVCLGRLGDIKAAEEILNDLIERGANEEATQYVHGEVLLASEDYIQAEAAFLKVLVETESSSMRRRCYISLGDLYRDCAALVRVGGSPISNPATKSAQLLSSAVVEDGLRFDGVLWEMLALAYFEAYHTDASVPANYLNKAADCFNRVIELGAVKEYLYSNLYTIYYEVKDYEKAEQALTSYEEMFPNDYMPHALRGMMLITIENQKPQEERNYTPVLEEYKAAGAKIRSSDETTYYQQLESLIENLRKNGWL